ncbi:MAG: hypothetical protein ACYDBW_10465 [Sulfuricaulis sp.]
MLRKTFFAAITAALVVPGAALAAAGDSPSTPADSNAGPSSEQRLQSLEQRVQQLESAPPPAAPPAAINSFNPAVSLILSGLYTNLSQDPANYRITGFPVPSGVDMGPGKRGFSLTESELGVYANIDPYFYGAMNYSIHPDDIASVEEAFIRTIGLSNGLSVKAGRFFSDIGYLNSQHSHTWDFVDAPLAYQAFLGTQFNDDAVQVKWLAPTDTFLEFGAELGRGRPYPGTYGNTNASGKNGVGAGTLFAHVGGDVGVSNSWRAGLSTLQTSPQNQEFSDTNIAGNPVTNSFSGNTHLWITDFVWKYAPNGNPIYTNFKLQAEYLRRHQDGSLTYDSTGLANTASYNGQQSGWYLQGVYQFMPYWRVGLRTERLDRGSVDYSSNAANMATPDFNPSKNSAMVDYSPSEFSRIRVQFARDKSRQGVTDNQAFVQYQMSLGAHGAHQF